MLLNRKYINDLTEELERAQETNKDCLKIIEFWRERSNKSKAVRAVDRRYVFQRERARSRSNVRNAIQNS